MAETIGNLIDKLTICNLRIWNAEDMKRNAINEPTKALRDKMIVQATEITNMTNQQRNDLIQEIDEKMNEIAEGKKQKLYKQGSTKMYGKKNEFIKTC